MEWRSLTQEEKAVVTPYYEKYYRKNKGIGSVMLFLMGALSVFEIVRFGSRCVSGAYTPEALQHLISVIVTYAMIGLVVTLLAKLLIKDREWQAIQKGTARICQTVVVAKRIGTYGWSESQGYGGPNTPIAHYVKVMLPGDEEHEVEVMSQVYNGANEGDEIYLFDPYVKPGETKEYKLFLKKNAERE